MGAPNWFEANRSRFTGQLMINEPLSRYTYYRIGGPARILAFPKTREDLAWIAEGLRATTMPLFVLGAGSNVLVSDQGFDGLVVRAGRLNLETVALPGDAAIRAGGSVAISTLLRRAVLEGWAGLEFLTGVPGSVGGAVVMNAGTHLGEAKDAVLRVEVVPLEGAEAGQSRIYAGPDQLKFQYRKNLFLPDPCIVWSVDWTIRREDPTRVKAVIDEVQARRKSTQPVEYPSCGSVFKNPKAYGKNAWQVLDALGLRGHQIGGAQISEKHSNFIVNRGGAKAADVRALIELCKARALSELGIPLEEEVHYVGTF